MGSQSKWKAKVALACYFVLIVGILVGSIILALILFVMGIDYMNPPFPVALIGTPINEAIILGITLLFARYERASLRKLGLKKLSLRLLTIVSVFAVFLFLLGLGISIGEEIVFGPDPTAEYLAKLMTPTNSFELIAMIVFSLVLVGPCEELAFRGFVQKGLENSFGKMKGLWVASVLFGLLHACSCCCWSRSWLRLAEDWWKYHRFGFDAWDKQLNIFCNSVFSCCLKTLPISDFTQATSTS